MFKFFLTYSLFCYLFAFFEPLVTLDYLEEDMAFISFQLSSKKIKNFIYVFIIYCTNAASRSKGTF